MTSLKIKWRCCCCLVLLLFSIPVYSQINITGRVVNENDDAPIQGASVYFNNTTIGTYTNQQGYFYFEGISFLNTELVISCTGYEVLVFKPTAAQVAEKRFIFKLQAKGQPLKNALIVTDAVRKRGMDIFQKNFLGITEEATKSTINNERNIYFTQGDSKTSFRAYADTPLVIINDMLGYKIRFDLVEFWYDEETGQAYFWGYTRFEELGDNKRWIKNRQHCYYGSTMHFYRSLITNQLYQQGFSTYLIQPVKNTTRAGQNSDPSEKSADGRMMAVPVSAQQILYIDSTNNFSIRLTGQLLVQYNKEPSSKNFLTQNIFMEGNLPRGVESYILFKASPIGLNNAGVLNDATNVEYSGYWIYEKVANMLPFNYAPG